MVYACVAELRFSAIIPAIAPHQDLKDRSTAALVFRPFPLQAKA
jgi:hypothetical protein